jgi:hypothetical protein
MRARRLSTWRRNGWTLRVSNEAIKRSAMLVSDFNQQQLLDVDRAA